MTDGGTVSNTATSAQIYGVSVGIGISGASGTVTNLGSVTTSGTNLTAMGVVLVAGGTVQNGEAGSDSGDITGENAAVYVKGRAEPSAISVPADRTKERRAVGERWHHHQRWHCRTRFRSLHLRSRSRHLPGRDGDRDQLRNDRRQEFRRGRRQEQCRHQHAFGEPWLAKPVCICAARVSRRW